MFHPPGQEVSSSFGLRCENLERLEVLPDQTSPKSSLRCDEELTLNSGMSKYNIGMFESKPPGARCQEVSIVITHFPGRSIHVIDD